MRYRLRTLLIVVTSACVVFAWVAFLRQMERFHRKEERKIVLRIVAAEVSYLPHVKKGARDEFVEARIEGLTADQRPRKGDKFAINQQQIPGSEEFTITNGQLVSTMGRGDIEDWRSAVHHRVMANKYHQAVFRPWVLISSDP
jgi:hypothetical protein